LFARKIILILCDLLFFIAPKVHFFHTTTCCFFCVETRRRGSFFLRKKKEKGDAGQKTKKIMGRPFPRGADDGSGEDDMVQNDEERLLSSSRAATTSTMGITSGFKRSGVLTIGCAFLFFALGYVSSPTRGTPILTSSSSLIANVPSSSSSSSSSSSHRSVVTSFPHLGSSFPQKNRHRFELLGGKEEQEQEEEEEEEKHRKETSKSTRNDKTDDDDDDDEKRNKIGKGTKETKETNALDAEIELEKDEHLLEHLQKSLNDNIETQEKETLKLVKMKVDEQDAEKMKEEEELTEEELGIHHSNEDVNVVNNDSGSSSYRNNEDDGSELGFKEKDNESEVKNVTTPMTFEDSILKNVSSELDEVIRDGKQSKSKDGDIVPRAAAFASMDDELQDVLDAVHAVDGSGGENSVNERNDVKLAHEKASSLSSSSSSSPSQSLERGERKAILPKGNPEETLGWTEADATTINPESITESAQSGVRSLVLNPEIVHDLKEKFEDMKNKGEVQVEGKWKKFDAEAKEEKKQMKEAKKMEEIVEESSKILDDIDAVRMAQSFDAGGGNKSFSWTFSYFYFPLIVLFSILLAVVALLIKTSEKSNLKRYGSTGSFDRSSPKRNGKNKLHTLEEEEEIYQTKDNTYPDFSNLRDFEKGNRIYNSSVESFEEDEFEDEDYDGDSIDDGSYDDDGDYDEEAFSERSSDVSSFQGFREKAIAVAKAAEEFLTNAKGGTARISNAGTFHGASKYGANETARDGAGVSASKKRGENGQRSSFVKSSTTKWI